MKKLFNFSVVMAMLFGSIAFTSCNKDDDGENEGEETEQPDVDPTPTPEVKKESISVVEGKTYAVTNASIEGSTLAFEVTKTERTAGSKVVELKITFPTSDAGTVITLGDDNDHASYLGRTADGQLTEMKQAIALENAERVILALSSEANDFLITSATVNAKVKAAGAKTSTFAESK